MDRLTELSEIIQCDMDLGQVRYDRDAIVAVPTGSPRDFLESRDPVLDCQYKRLRDLTRSEAQRIYEFICGVSDLMEVEGARRQSRLHGEG